MLILANAGTLNGGLSLRLKELENLAGGFLVGGVASSRIPLEGEDHFPHGDLNGVVFSETVPVATALTQGCIPIGQAHTITACEGDYIIKDLDHRSSYEVFQEDLRDMAISDMGVDPQEIELKEVNDEEQIWEDIPPELRDFFQGEVHVAFPIPGSDQSDYLVRNILGFDHEQGLLAVGQAVHNGDRVMFVHRNRETMRADLCKTLLDLRARVEEEQGAFMPKGAVYISCVARAEYDLSSEGSGQNELSLIREILGPVPLTGFYAGGEILKGRIYGYTGILTLFL
jgi:small ligand-binding sensory domain FIST